jgi:gamma-butyrobetaine dioxygenase
MLRGLPAVWLRANCPCGACRDPGSGQRLVTITGVPADVTVAEVRVAGTVVEVVFGPDGHRAVFDPHWLARYGEPGAMLAVTRSLGYVRETNYGRLFEVRAEPTPANLAFTRRPIAPHTDNPYRDPVPTLQLLHCLRSTVGGGESTFSDGFRAAAVLRSQDPAAFACLPTTPVTFAYSDEATELWATGPMIGLDPRGRIRQVRFNDRSLTRCACPRRRPRRSTPPTAPSPSGSAARRRR